MDRLDAWLAVLAARAGWAAPAKLVNAAGTPTDDPAVVAAARNAQSYEGADARWRVDSLPAATAAVLQRNTQCDATLYDAATALLDDAEARAQGG